MICGSWAPRSPVSRLHPRKRLKLTLRECGETVRSPDQSGDGAHEADYHDRQLLRHEGARATFIEACSTTFLGDNPDQGSMGWTDANNGIAHDAGNWFFTVRVSHDR
jgi:hypothetical protein